MGKRNRPLNAARRVRRERNRVLIVTEGLKTEIQYLEGLAQYLRASGTSVRGVRSKGVGKDPARVLRAAMDLNAQDPDGYDEIWVVVDVDEHTTLETAVRTAKETGIPLVVSNPCFEIWLIWHYEDCSAHHETRAAVRRLEKFGHTEKRIPNSFPFDACDEAVRRAEPELPPSAVGPNPSTAMPSLLRSLKGSS